MTSDEPFDTQARQLLEACLSRGLMIVTAESCTGGLVAGALTAVPGSSAVLERGFVTYSNNAKEEMLGVEHELIMREGAVSQSVAFAMAEGALQRSRADLAVAVTGIAGPGGGSDLKPVGCVHFAAVSSQGGRVHVEKRFGSMPRAQIRHLAVAQALNLLLDLASGCRAREV